jgi:hypothetical protein
MIKIVEEKVSQVFQKNGFKPWVCNMNQWKKMFFLMKIKTIKPALFFFLLYEKMESLLN